MDMANKFKSQSWVFLNSNFGLFMMSSIVLSFITWSYAQWTDSLEKEKARSAKFELLGTEISYRVQVMDNYFESECTAEKLGIDTFRDLEEIYSATSSYKAIFAENTGKELHTLIWEVSAIQKDHVKHQYVSCFDSLLLFNAYLNRLLNELDTQGLFYNQQVNYEKEIKLLKGMFRSAMGELGNDRLLTMTQSEPVKVEVFESHGRVIPEEIRDKIFQPIFTTKPTGEGTGLGLSMGYDIITKGHGGEIKVETRQGKGSECIIVLPV